MRYLGLVSAALLVLSTSPSYAQQGWREVVSQEEFFMVSMPAEPVITETTYTAASGTVLPAKRFVASEGESVFSMTVVHYMDASAAEIEAALEYEIQNFRDRGQEITYDRPQVMEGLPGHMIYLSGVEQRRTAAGIFLHVGPTEHGGPGRLYILEGNAPETAPSPIHFPQSFFLLDAAGLRLDYETDDNGQRVRNYRAPQEHPGAEYSARDPVSCDARGEPTQGQPTAAQVALHVQCTAEGIGDGSLFLLENVVVSEVGDGEALDTDYYPDIDTAHLAYPVRGNLVRYECRRENADNVGTNCVSHVEENASGTCYRSTEGHWNCSMSDLVTRTTPGVAPPQ